MACMRVSQREQSVGVVVRGLGPAATASRFATSKLGVDVQIDLLAPPLLVTKLQVRPGVLEWH
eukprot:577367-Pleurochrysis_carterae.AAC.1